jgi:phosphohistidine swiveling domain-containing protein
MESKSKFIVPLERAYEYPVSKVGGKTRNVSICRREGFAVPDGFCITTDSYRAFIKGNKLSMHIDMEVNRKSYDDMRWEEIWDAALRIRSSFVKGQMPGFLEKGILEALSEWPDDTVFAVRSSSPDEDSKEYSFAGVHESYVNVIGHSEVIEKVKLVWASLWSDRSLLYKKEKSLDSFRSSMAVLVQKMEPREVSGLAFSADPSKEDRDHVIIEAIRGTLDLLVDNVKSPERFRLRKETGEVESRMLLEGERILDDGSLAYLHSRIMELERIFGEPVDIEWTGLKGEFTVLQVRPITVFKEDRNTERKWYLTLTPKGQKLVDLAERVENVLIPELEKACESFSGLSPDGLERSELLEALKDRGESYDRWTRTYWDEFIPFAHGIRNFGTFYNDIVKPHDPYEFVLLLKSEGLMAQRRNMDMASLADELSHNPDLRSRLKDMIRIGLKGGKLFEALDELKDLRMPASHFIGSFVAFLQAEMDMTYDGVSLELSPEIALGVILSMSDMGGKIHMRAGNGSAVDLARMYLEKAEESGRLEEAERWLRIGRVSWKLRDDDNMLLGKLENQLLLFMAEGARALLSDGRLDRIPEIMVLDDWKKVHDGLSRGLKIELAEGKKESVKGDHSAGKARQLLGQPSSPGLLTGKARVIRSIDDFKSVENGEVLVFDAVQPQMTFIISLAGAIIERRGGMLVHSSIIAREMNIPAVNGVSRATELIRTGDVVTVNGDLGIVILGKPEFEVELNI